jgi:hypothetical protein
MMINFKDIDYNPHRDTKAYPIDPVQVEALKSSIAQTGFWDNLLVRWHPQAPGRYQLAYGHHRLEAAIECGLVSGDIPCRPLSEDDMLHIMIKENATQKGGQSAAASLDSVKAILRRLSYIVLANDYEHVSTIVETLFGSAKSYDTAKGRLVNGHGMGEDTIQAYDNSLDVRDVRSALGVLKADGSLATILRETHITIEGEKVAAEKIEAELREAERLEEEKQAAAEKLAAEQAAARAKEQKESEARLAKLRADRKLVEAEAEAARQARLKRDIAIEAERREKRKAAEAVEVKRRVEAEDAASQRREAAAKQAEDARKAAESAPVQTLGKGVAKHFNNSHQLDVFRKAMLSETSRRFISMEKHEPIAAAIAKMVTDSEERHAAWLVENEGVKLKARKNEPTVIRMTADLIRGYITTIGDEALGIQARTSNADNANAIARVKAEKGRDRVQMANHLTGAERAILSFEHHINGVRSLVRRNPELAESISVGRLQVAARKAEQQIESFYKTIESLDLSVNQ